MAGEAALEELTRAEEEAEAPSILSVPIATAFSLRVKSAAQRSRSKQFSQLSSEAQVAKRTLHQQNNLWGN